MDAPRVVPADADPALLAVYLNDHLAGANGGVSLARRLAANHRGTEAGTRLTQLAAAIEQDRRSLVAIIQRLDVRRARAKELLAGAVELAGRVKPNGALLSRSPLSSVLELEAMRLGVEGKAAGWRSLRQLVDVEPRLDASELDRLIARAEDQIRDLEEMRMTAVTEALGERPGDRPQPR